MAGTERPSEGRSAHAATGQGEHEAARFVAEKAQLRARLRERLASLDAGATQRAGAAIAEVLGRMESWRRAGAIAAFVSRPDEVDTGPVLERARREGKRVLLPRVLSGTALAFAAWPAGAPLVVGRFGLREPAPEAPVVPLGEAGIVLVPGLAFDAAGGRLGRGAGYYDRALADARAAADPPPLIGLALALQIVEAVPMAPFDVRLDGVVCETGRVGARPGPARRTGQEGDR